MIVNILLLILICIQLYVIWNLNKKTETYEDMISEYETYLDEVTTAVTDINNRLKEIDHRGTFESDDEVGYFFKALKSLVEQLNTITGDTDATKETQEEK
tara:strand:- start:1059 stop:1358 length:300 start_codon:yes stop_codon:yes gene_type:complete